MVHEKFIDLFVNAYDLLVVLFIGYFNEKFDQFRDVFPALAQRRHKKRYDMDAVIEVFPKISLFHQLFQVLVGGHDDAGIGFQGLCVPHPFKAAVLQDAQQFDLQIRRTGVYLIQKNGAVIGDLKTPFFILDSPGEGAFGMAEEFAFKQGLG